MDVNLGEDLVDLLGKLKIQIILMKNHHHHHLLLKILR